MISDKYNFNIGKHEKLEITALITIRQISGVLNLTIHQISSLSNHVRLS